ncbi:MAG TPA: CDP-alcohol phosphatidyltransferase family protein [Candidatus Acidoferrum sp.]|nr:CDP-alcohol phosphatidyltransferase family protein [Candidatus Acidoferrum sp.]
MLDSYMRRMIDPPLDRAGRRLAAAGVPANGVTVAGFAAGLLAIPCLAAEWYGLALIAILLNRLADGLDGAVARHTALTDFGGYLDIVCDFIVYAAVAFGFALARPVNALPAAFLILSFVGTGSSFLAYAILAAKRGLSSEARGRKSLYYLGGLTEGTETIAFFAAFCFFPGAFPVLACIFGGLCWLTTAVRIATARRAFG